MILVKGPSIMCLIMVIAIVLGAFFVLLGWFLIAVEYAAKTSVQFNSNSNLDT